MIYPERIRQAREIRSLRQEGLAKKIGKSKAIIAQVEGNFKLISDELLSLIADATEFPIGFFSAPPHQEFPFSDVLFRARAAVKRRNTLNLVRQAEHVFHIGARIAKGLRQIPVTLNTLADPPALAAAKTRKALGLSPLDPVPHLIRTLERAGVWFIALENEEGKDAFCVWTTVRDVEVPVITIWSKEHGDRLRLSVAHELGHLVMHKVLTDKSQKEVESEAFLYAAELMMPEEAMRRELVAPVTLTSVARLKPRWGVSIQALVRRAYDLHIIAERQYHYLFQQLSAKGWRTQEPKQLDIAAEKPRLLRLMAESVYGYPIDFRKMAAELFIREQELRRIMSLYADRSEVLPDATVNSNVVRFSKR
jgi:Zn-dependent peptidase ImmA (M78 family)/transcriptional regulator with XRE-family HTH domain